MGIDAKGISAGHSKLVSAVKTRILETKYQQVLSLEGSVAIPGLE